MVEVYRGIVTRTSVDNTAAYIGGKRTHGIVVGCIPDSLKTGRKEWIDDLVFYKNYYMTDRNLRSTLKVALISVNEIIV